MKKVVLVLNPEKVKLLEKSGFSSCGVRVIGGNKAHQFVMTNKLRELLEDNTLFSKRDYFEDNKMTF